MTLRNLWLLGLCLLLAASVCAQQPIDIFPDDPPVGTGFIRIGSWNLRHINLESGAREFLPGTTEAEDFAILTATFAKAIRDLGLDMIAIEEHQPRAGEPNRLHQIRDHLNGGSSGPWRADETAIPYDDTSSQFGNLQFGLLWNSTRVTINPSSNTLLAALRQPRNAAGDLTEQTLRIPWLVPVQAGNLGFDLIVLHLKSGGVAPQAAEVTALEQFIRERLSMASPRHLIVCGDWNIRPDQEQGRNRLTQMSVPVPGGTLMRVLTVEQVRPTIPEWDQLGSIPVGSPVAGLVPFSHFNASSLDTFLDHIAISRTFDEIFDHPIQVTLANGTTDLRPGIKVAVPLVPENIYSMFTDHVPVVLTLRTGTAGGGTPDGPSPGVPGLRIAAAIPNPVGDDAQDEEVHLANTGPQAVPLAGWRIGDATGSSFWTLQASDGTVPAGGTVIVRRKGRPMALTNTGDAIVLINPSGTTVDQKTYGNAASGQLFTFN